MDFYIKQYSELPALELKYIPTQLNILDDIKYAQAYISIYDKSECPIVLNKQIEISLDTAENNYKQTQDSCDSIVNFILRYVFDKRTTSNAGDFDVSIKIVFNNPDYQESKELTLPKINLHILQGISKI